MIISEADRYIKEKNGSKYLVFDSVNENNKVLKNIMNFEMGLKMRLTIKHSSVDNDKDFMKIKFNSDDNLPLNKTLKLHNMTLVIRSIFEEHGKSYLQFYLDEFLYELI